MLDWGQIMRSDALLPRLSRPTCPGSPVLPSALVSCALQDPCAFADEVLKPLFEGSGSFTKEQERLVVHVLQCRRNVFTGDQCNLLVEAMCQVLSPLPPV